MRQRLNLRHFQHHLRDNEEALLSRMRWSAIGSKSNLLLYAAYISTCLEDRAWSFCISLCMQHLGGMRLVSIEQFAESIGQMFLSGHLGRVFDRVTRKVAIMSVIPVNNVTIVLSAAMFIICLSVQKDSVLFGVVLGLGILMCAINRLFLNAEKFLVSRDWVVVISSGETLSGLNATLTSLDQLANVISPIVTGVFVTVFSLRVTCAIFGGLSLVSMLSKAFFLRALYMRHPELANKQNKENAGNNNNDEKTPASLPQKILNALKDIPDILLTYTRQTVVAAAFGMALLFMTVMGFDGLAVGYGESSGLSDAVVGAFRSYGSVMGILGAMSYACFERRFGVRSTGLLGLTYYFWPGALPLLQSNSETSTISPQGRRYDSIITFLAGIASARFGLWMADLSIIHIMQEGVPETDRNTVFGLHNALCQTFSLLKDILVIILPDPATFGICILISYGFVTTGYLSFVYYLIKHPADETQNEKVADIEKEQTQL
ncbi:unnamed protein product [Cylicocyclus nassatus]|uniref:Solute carrier family 40 member n=1 Tax=Cylicocyclus nassatus TaxID=53992 RepID=A0AA36GCY6_CYLNA|nr:unnamed protein product [Cylicocyclus nassatus]